MNVLITGGAGFIGSHLAEHYLSRKDGVSVIDNLSTGRIGNIKAMLDRGSFGELVIENVANYPTMDRLIQKADMVYHLAAPVGVKYIMRNPVKTLIDNTRGADVVLELCNKYRKPVLIASSSEVYGKVQDIHSDPLKEDSDRLMGTTTLHRWAYANTKAYDELLALAYHKEYDLPVVVVRFFNTTGPRQVSEYGMVVPTFVRSALASDPINIYGTGDQSRCFLHVSDAINAVTSLMETPEAYGQIFNVGSSEECTIKGLASTIIYLTESKSEVRNVDYKSAYGDGFEDMTRRTPDTTKLRALTGFNQKHSLTSTILDIIKYWGHK